MEFVEEVEKWPTTPVSPISQYFNSSSLSLEVVGVVETTVRVDTSRAFQWLRDVFLPSNPRFSSVMETDQNGMRVWRKYDINLKEHVRVPVFPSDQSPEIYQEYSSEYLSRVAMESLQKDRALWEIHVVNYPTTNSHGHIIFKLHHAIGDGYSLMGALLTLMKRADNPSLPLTFPSRQSASRLRKEFHSFFPDVPRILTGAVNYVVDLGRALVISRIRFIQGAMSWTSNQWTL